MAFDASTLGRRLAELTPSPPRRYLVAYSGGLDSTVLLHAMTRIAIRVPLVAVHVDHGLHPDAQTWARHCRSAAAALDVEYVERRVRVEASSGAGPEAAARAARYAEFEALLEEGDNLLSAHHEDDQAETLLLNLLRGSGMAGLAGIGAARPLGRGRLLRPLLGVSRADLEVYAKEAGLRWIEDPANRDTRYDRNFLRHRVLPLLAERWPAATGRLARSAALAGESAALLEALASIDLGGAGGDGRLPVSTLEALSAPRQRNLLRYVIARLGLPAAPATALERIVAELLPARADAEPVVAWDGGLVRRYRDRVYVLAADLPSPAGDGGVLLPGDSPLALGPGLGTLSLERFEGEGIAAAVAGRGLRVRYRSGGEKLTPAGRAERRPLKKLLQEAAIVPWMRDRIPLLFDGDELVAVGDLWTAAGAVATPGYAVRWRGRPALH